MDFRGGAETLSSNNSKAVTAQTLTTIGSFTITKGTWLITSWMDANVDNAGMMIQTIQVVGDFDRSTRATMAGGGHVYLMTSASATLAANDYIYYNIEAPVAGKFTGSIRAFLIN